MRLGKCQLLLFLCCTFRLDAGDAPILLDFDQRADGTPFEGEGDMFLQDEYAASGVILRDSDSVDGSTNVNLTNSQNENTRISGYYVNVGVFVDVDRSFLEVEFSTPATDVSFDFSTPSGDARVVGIDPAGKLNLSADIAGQDTFFSQSGAGFLAGQFVSDKGLVFSRLRIEAPTKQALIVDNLSFRPEASGLLPFLRCDSNGDGRRDIADSVWTIKEIFLDGPQTACEQASDCNGDGGVDTSDAIFGMLYQFSDGPAPPPPFPVCGSVKGEVLSCDFSSCS